MKKLVATLIATGMLVGMGTVLGQLDQSHDVTVTLPELLAIRMVNTADDPLAPVTPGAVVFNLGGLDVDSFVPADTYYAAAANWNNVLVYSNYSAWEVNIALGEPTVGVFNWSKVLVPGRFRLNAGATVGSGVSPTGGWQPLNFGPTDFALELDGTEVAGTYSVRVTYTITGTP
jgi:hypothetical protein